MRRRSFTGALVRATLLAVVNHPLAAIAETVAVGLRKKTIAVGTAVDGIVIRGACRAYVTLGDPSLTLEGSEAALREVTVARFGTTLTIRSPETGPVLQISATVARLRGVATSGSVRLTIDDRSDAPLFLDLAGSGTVRARGAVPLLRVTTSGTVAADLAALIATRARVHARQSSRLSIRARDELTIIALDRAGVSYEALNRVTVTSRDRATVTKL